MSPGKIAKIVAVVAFASVILVVLLDRFIGEGTIPWIFQPSTSEPAGDSGKPAAEPAPPPRPRGSKTRATESEGKSNGVKTLPATPQSASVKEEISVGMTRSQVIERLGNPTLRATQTNNGRLLERFIYVDRDRHTITIAVLENGNTVNFESKPYTRLNLPETH
ncbi:MAG TPA: hypothetical protein VMZ52_20465 [Bryobacteraceae bacterium]|nr:hypothetical protein [Bryobacteraceae bacterium]